MFRYMFLLSRTMIKKISFYIAILFSMAIFAIIISLNISFSNDQHFSALGAIDSWSALMLFNFSTVFTLLVVVHIFKQGEIDGSELMIVAKPITRKEILGGKFLMLILTLILFQLVMAIDFGILASLDSYATTSARISWVFSLVVGGLIVQLIVASIVILLTSVLGRIGTIVVTLTVTALLGILSIVFQILGFRYITPTNYSAVHTSGANGQNYYLNNEELTNEILDDESAFYNYKNGILNNADIKDYPESDYYSLASNFEYKLYEENSWYLQAAYADLWYQWSRFYTIFNNNEKNALSEYMPSPTKYVKSSWDDLASENKFMIGDEEYIWIYDWDTNTNIVNKNEDLKAQLALELDAQYLAHKLEKQSDFKNDFINEKNLFKQLRLIKYYELKESNPFIEINNLTLDKYQGILIYLKTYLVLSQNWDEDFNTTSVEVPQNIFNDDNFKLQDMGLYNETTFTSNILIIDSEPIIQTWVVILIWVIIGAALLGGAILIYAYRDFK